MKTLRARMDDGEFVCLEGDSPMESGQEYRAFDFLKNLGWEPIRLISQGVPWDDFLWWNLPETNIDQLELLIADYDYYYQMSDDHRVYIIGKARDAKIEHLAHLVGRTMFVELWNKYVQANVKNYGEGFTKYYLITPENELFK